MTVIVVERPGPFTTFQDLGRPGWQHLGVPSSGAADRGAALAANALVGNDPGATVLETTLSGPLLRFCRAAVVALCGAPAASTVGGRPAPHGEPFRVAAGELLDVGATRGGLRTVIAVAGGFDVPRVLGSAATDTLTGLGPPPLAVGDELAVAAGARGRARAVASLVPVGNGAGPLEVVPGPRTDSFTSDALVQLTTADFTVDPASSRVGVRLQGPTLGYRPGLTELRSEGMVAGAIQVPPAGLPIILLRDHPATGGYPVIGVLTDAAIDRAAQLRPGAVARFAAAGPGLPHCGR